MERIAEKYEQVVNHAFKHHSLYTETDWKKMLKRSGLEVEKMELIIPKSIVPYWDLLLLPALPSQLTKVIFGKRLVLRNRIRVNLASIILEKIIKNADGVGTNFLVVARKPKIPT